MKRRAQPMGAKAVRGSDAARRLAALLLEAMSGIRTTQSAADAMGVSLPRYYVLEARGLNGMVAALEPRARGRQRTLESEMAKLRAETKRLEREVSRWQSLYRVGQRSLGLVAARPPKPDAEGGKRRRKPRKRARGEVLARVLQPGEVRAESTEVGDGEAAG